MKLLRRINALLVNTPAEIYFAMLLIYFFLRNIFMPLSHDDYAYAFIWDGEHGGNLDGMHDSNEPSHRERVNSFSDIIKSQYSHYFTWGGRVIAHSLAQFFIWIGKPYFDVANTIVFALFIIVILKLSDTPLRKSKFAIVWIFVSIFFVATSFKPSVVIFLTWLTGACSYLWMSLFQLTFLLQYVNAIRSEEINDSAIKIAVIALMGILAGWSNESGSLATIFLTAFLIYECRRLKRFSRWMFVGLIALIIGSALCILAPGNLAQTNFIQSVNPNFNYTPKLFINHLLNGFLPIIAIDIFVLLPMIYFFARRGFYQLNISERSIIAFTVAGLIIPLAMMFSPKFDLSRILIINLSFILVAAISAYRQAGGFDFNIKLTEIIFPITAMILALKTQILNYLGGITANENYCLNIMVAEYYGVKSIAGRP